MATIMKIIIREVVDKRKSISTDSRQKKEKQKQKQKRNDDKLSMCIFCNYSKQRDSK